MAVPKSKITKSKRGMRRAHDAIDNDAYVENKDTGELIGAHMVGPEVTELIQGFSIAKKLETTEYELMHTIFPHPTLSEGIHESVLDAYNQAIHY